MDIEKIIRFWKAEEDEWEISEFANPVGEVLTEEELLQVSGGDSCVLTVCNVSCTYTCDITCNASICADTACRVTDCGLTHEHCVRTIWP